MKKDFTFHVNGKDYQTSRIIADILSPTIRKFHYTDGSVNEFTLTTKTKFDESQEDFFLDFLDLGRFFTIKIEGKRQQKFIEYFQALGNFDDFINIQPKFVKVPNRR